MSFSRAVTIRARKTATWLFILGGGIIMGSLALRPGEASLTPVHPIENWTSTNIPFALRSTGRMLLLGRGGYTLHAEVEKVETNIYGGGSLFSTAYAATPANPHLCDVVVPPEVTRFQVSMNAYQGSTLRARLADLFTDKTGRIRDPMPPAFWDFFVDRLEPRYLGVEIKSPVFTRTDAGWKHDNTSGAKDAKD